MKRLSRKRKNWFLNRAWRQARRKSKHAKIKREASRHPTEFKGRLVNIWQGGEIVQAMCRGSVKIPPSELCFETDPNSTTTMLSEIRDNFLKPQSAPPVFVQHIRRRRLPKVGGYVDFSQLTRISTAAAVVLTADYERYKFVCGQVPPAVNLTKWNPEVRKKLYQLGFFNILGHIPASMTDMFESDSGQSMTMPIVSAENGNDFALIDQGLGDLINFLGVHDPDCDDDPIVPLMTAMSEALTNVTQHAYPSDHNYVYNPLSKFWVSATANKTRNSLTIVIFDQGATIPITYPRIERKEKVKRFLTLGLRKNPEFDYQDDGTYIRAALKYGGSRTDEPFRGKGFPQMTDAVQHLGKSSLKIRSRGGWALKLPLGRIKSGAQQVSLGGTLVEWDIEFDNAQRAN